MFRSLYGGSWMWSVIIIIIYVVVLKSLKSFCVKFFSLKQRNRGDQDNEPRIEEVTGFLLLSIKRNWFAIFIDLPCLDAGRKKVPNIFYKDIKRSFEDDEAMVEVHASHALPIDITNNPNLWQVQCTWRLIELSSNPQYNEHHLQRPHVLLHWGERSALSLCKRGSTISNSYNSSILPWIPYLV